MEDYKKLADVNLWGLIEVTKTFLPLVKKAEGRIVNISSGASKRPFAARGNERILEGKNNGSS